MEDFCDIVIEALEIFINHILSVRDIYPSQIFKNRRIYNTTVYASIYPPLNTYLHKVLKAAKELLKTGSLECMEMLVQKDDHNEYESYKFHVASSKNTDINDEFLLDFEEKLRGSLSTLAQRLKNLEKLPTDANFKILMHTNQSAFTKLTHNSHYQEFPWLRADITSGKINQEISLLPLANIRCLDLNITAEIF